MLGLVLWLLAGGPAAASAGAAVPAEPPATAATVLAAKTFPGVQLIRTDYSATVSVPAPVLNEEAVEALFQRVLNQARAGVIDSSQEAVNEAVVADIAGRPFAYLDKSSEIVTEPGTLSSVGTGWVITGSGDIVTAAHVVRADPEEMKRQFALTTLSDMNRRFVEALAAGEAKYTDDQTERLSGALTDWLARYMTVGDVQTTVTAQVAVAGPDGKTQQGRPVTVVAVGEPYPGKDVALLRASGSTAMPTLSLGGDEDVAVGSTRTWWGSPPPPRSARGCPTTPRCNPP